MVHLSAQTWDAICQHAQETFPEECCGAILTRAGQEKVYRMTNIQNLMHAKDPQTYPRDARTAYLPDSKELLALNREVDDGRAVLQAFYHSHPDHDAYFSAEDKKQAMFGDEPGYPGAFYIVISIYAREVKEIRAYAWDENKKDFVGEELSTDV